MRKPTRRPIGTPIPKPITPRKQPKKLIFFLLGFINDDLGPCSSSGSKHNCVLFPISISRAMHIKKCHFSEQMRKQNILLYVTSAINGFSKLDLNWIKLLKGSNIDKRSRRKLRTCDYTYVAKKEF